MVGKCKLRPPVGRDMWICISYLIRKGGVVLSSSDRQKGEQIGRKTAKLKVVVVFSEVMG